MEILKSRGLEAFADLTTLISDVVLHLIELGAAHQKLNAFALALDSFPLMTKLPREALCI